MSVSILTMFSALKRNKIVMTRGVNQIFWIYHSSVIIYFHLSLITVIFNYFNISLKAIALSYALDKILKPLFQRFKHVKKSFFFGEGGKIKLQLLPLIAPPSPVLEIKIIDNQSPTENYCNCLRPIIIIR